MEHLLLVGFIVILIFGIVVFFGAPYLPTLNEGSDEIFSLLKLKEDQHLLELGSGDGRILREAAKRGIKSTGYEINPILVVFSIILTWKYRDNVTVKWGNFWTAHWPETDAIYVFLLQKYMAKLNNKIVQEVSKPVKLVSYAFTIPDKKPTKESKGMSLYRYQ